MRPITAWAHMMSSTVTIEPRTALDVQAKPTYGAATSYRAHIARERQVVRSAGGEQSQSNQAIYLMTADPIHPSSRLTLSTGDALSTSDTALHPEIVAVERRSDGSGPHHVVLFLRNRTLEF